MSADEYYELSDSRAAVTPDNFNGLVRHPALFHAMTADRELRPARSEAAAANGILYDFMTLDTVAFHAKYLVDEGPVNPKTGKPYGRTSKAYAEWEASLTKPSVHPDELAVFDRLASAYSGHKITQAISDGAEVVNNAVFTADLCGVACACLVNKLYAKDDGVFAVVIKPTEDLNSVGTAPGGAACIGHSLALTELILAENGIAVLKLYRAMLERNKLPRCGYFDTLPEMRYDEAVLNRLADYSACLGTGKFVTKFDNVISL